METQRNNRARGYSLFSANHSAEDQLAIIAELGSIAPEALSLSGNSYVKQGNVESNTGQAGFCDGSEANLALAWAIKFRPPLLEASTLHDDRKTFQL